MTMLDLFDRATIRLDPPEHYALLMHPRVEDVLCREIRDAHMGWLDFLAWQDRCINGVPLFVTVHVERYQLVQTDGDANTLAPYLPPIDIEAYARWLVARNIVPTRQGRILAQ